MRKNIETPLRIVLETLIAHGYEAYAVGGFVRDVLLGRESRDYDIATNALPEEVINIFAGDYTIAETGLKHGTVTVVIHDDEREVKHNVEITTFRVDGEYSDNRRPRTVSFTHSLENDLSRRDFTVNAMAMDINGKIFDFHGGKRDLQRGIIRAVGDPDKRFNEDALRIMRGIRFACTYGFVTEEHTRKAVFRNKHLLKNLSGERKREELCKFLMSEHSGKIQELLLEYSDVFGEIIPEINDCKGFNQNTKYHNRDVLEHTACAVTSADRNLTLRLAMLLHDLGKPAVYTEKSGTGHFYGHQRVSAETARRVMRELRFDNKTSRDVVFLVENHDMAMNTDRAEIKRNMRISARYAGDTETERFLLLIDVHIADDTAKVPEFAEPRVAMYKEIKSIVNDILEKKECYNTAGLDVNGRDLADLGYKGEKIGEILDRLTEEVISGQLANERERLLERIKLCHR